MTTLDRRFAALRPRIDLDTARALDEALGALEAGDAADALVDAARDAIRSGKRLRALLAHFGASLGSGAPIGESDVHLLGAALELYQASALVHDDLIDKAQTRRGIATPHVRFARAHAHSSWSGSAPDFGAAAAVLLGDLLFSAAESTMIRQSERLPHDRATRLLARYAHMHAEVALGQYLDVRAENLPLRAFGPSVPDAHEVVLRKSARYSVVQPALLGAMAAGADEEVLRTLESALTPWGIAFQLRDDDLGVFGDPEVTGKPAGDDIREGKRTVLLALTWEKSSEAERLHLERALGNPDPGPGELAEAADIIAARGRAGHEGLIEALIEEGAHALDDSALTPQMRSDLLELSRIITARTN